MARIERAAGPGGTRHWVLHFPPLEARLIDNLPEQLVRLLGHPDENRRVVDRLFPPSYADARDEEENRKLLGGLLLEQREEMLAAVRAQLKAATRDKRGLRVQLDEAGVDIWLRFVNDVRLVLATDLDIKTNLSDVKVPRGHPDAPRHSLLVYLTGLEAALIASLTDAPEP
jgi:Domain of unknown function (DUF2017)